MPSKRNRAASSVAPSFLTDRQTARRLSISIATRIAAAVAVLGASVAVGASSSVQAQTVATWESGIATIAGPRASGHTVRQFARVAVGGVGIRIRISNETGTKPLAIADAHVALPGSTPGSIDPSSDRLVLFDTGRTATVPPGGFIVSDPVDMAVAPLTRLAVSAYVVSASPNQVGHLLASEKNYLALGDHSAEATMAGARATGSGFYLSGIYAVTGQPGGAVACLGDSITDGLYSTLDAEHRYPDRLTERLLAATHGRIGAVNAGIAGNGLLEGGPQSVGGISAVDRLARDVLSRPGVHWLVVFEGVNDIIYPPDAGDTAAELIAAYGKAIAKAHAAGVKVFGATITPYAGAGTEYWSPAKEAIRQRVNDWIRTSNAYDAVFDFDAVVRDPAAPARLRRVYDGGDRLHLSDTGYAAIAASIPLGVLINGGS